MKNFSPQFFNQTSDLFFNRSNQIHQIKHQIYPRDNEIQGWCPLGSVLPQGEGASLALVGHPSSDGVTVKMPYWVDVLHLPIGLIKTESGFIVRLVETGLRR